MSILADSTSLTTGAIVASQYAGLGATGAAIKVAGATGEHGPGVGLNDGLLNASEYLFEVASQPAAGSVILTELGQATMTVTADGAYTWAYRLREDGVYQGGTFTVTVNIGAVGLALGAANCTQPNTCTGGAVTFTAPGITLAAANCTQVNTCTTGAVTILTPGVLPTVISAARTYSVPKDTTANMPGQGIRLPLIWLIDLDANLDFACDWAAWLADGGDTLASVYVSADPLQLLVTISGVVQTTKSAAMIRPQQLGTWPLNFRMTTMQGRVDERTVLLEVVQR